MNPGHVVAGVELLRRFGGAGPRYTSYPSADRFSESIGSASLVHRLQGRYGDAPPLSLYLHLPYCRSLCYFCGCNKLVTKQRSRIDDYLRVLLHEIDLMADALSGSRRVTQVHLGGGSPSWLDDTQLAHIFSALRRNFDLAPDGEYAIEIDPRGFDPPRAERLAALGLNRASLGVQDFDAAVQRAVNRVQSVAETQRTIEALRGAGFRSVAVDLIHGLPLQTRASMASTVEQVIAMAPDRIAAYAYAHLPQRFKPQRRIDPAHLPSSEERLWIVQDTLERLQGAGYVSIGMDHFARPDDELVLALRSGRLQRNFQGYSTQAECDLLGCGVSAISRVGDLYCQNSRDIEDYRARLDAGKFAVVRGIELDRDDKLRRELIQDLMCRFRMSPDSLEAKHGIAFDDYFRSELAELTELAGHGLLQREGRDFVVTPVGRLLVRRLCMVFDRYLHTASDVGRYSRLA